MDRQLSDSSLNFADFFFSVVTFLEKHSFTSWNYEFVLNRIVGLFLNLIICLFKPVVRFGIFEGLTFLSGKNITAISACMKMNAALLPQIKLNCLSVCIENEEGKTA